MVEKGPRLIGREDEDVSDAIRDILEAEGIAVRLAAECIRFAHPAGARVGVDCADGRAGSDRHAMCCWRWGGGPIPTISGSRRLALRPIRAASSPSTTSCGQAWQASGRSATATARGAFTHTAYNDFEIVAANLLDDDPRKVSATASRPMRCSSTRRSAAPA